jgi:hypothetical protein
VSCISPEAGTSQCAGNAPLCGGGSGAFLFFGNNFSFSSSDELISITSRLCELSSFSSSSSALSLFSENPFVFSSYVYNVVFDVFWISQSALIKKDVSYVDLEVERCWMKDSKKRSLTTSKDLVAHNGQVQKACAPSPLFISKKLRKSKHLK